MRTSDVDHAALTPVPFSPPPSPFPLPLLPLIAGVGPDLLPDGIPLALSSATDLSGTWTRHGPKTVVALDNGAAPGKGKEAVAPPSASRAFLSCPQMEPGAAASAAVSSWKC